MAVSVGCASNGNPRDPFEPVNRKIYSFNSAVDRTVLEPTARAYKNYVPYVLQYSFRSFLSNIGDVWIGANNLMQGKPRQAVNDWTRVLLNTTIGFLGFSDPATEFGLRKSREDFGQTLGVWGVPTGPYLVLPLLGPSSVRGATGWTTDYLADPIDSVLTKTRERNFSTVVGVLDTRASLLGATSILQGAALDEYSFVRDGYLQRRRNMVYDGNPPYEE